MAKKLIGFVLVIALMISGCGSDISPEKFNEISDKYETCRTENTDLKVEIASLRSSIENGISSEEERKALDFKKTIIANDIERIERNKEEFSDLRAEAFQCGEKSGIAKQAIEQVKDLRLQNEELRERLKTEEFFKNISLIINVITIVVILTTGILFAFFKRNIVPVIINILSRFADEKYIDVRVEDDNSISPKELPYNQEKIAASSNSEQDDTDSDKDE